LSTRVPELLKQTGHRVKTDKVCVQTCIRKNSFALQYASGTVGTHGKYWDADRGESVPSGVALQYASMAAVKEDGNALQYASDALKADEEVVLAAVKVSGTVLDFARHPATGDKQVALAAVRQNGKSFEFAADSVKSDKKVVLQIVKTNGESLRYISDEFKADKEVVNAAIEGKTREHKLEILKHALNFVSETKTGPSVGTAGWPQLAGVE